MSGRSNVSSTELEILKVLWEQGPETVRGILAALAGRRDWAYTTVLTLLRRLQEKGFVKADRRRQAHVFRASVSREELVGRRLDHLADELCDGAATPIVQALVEGRRIAPEEAARLRALLDDLEAGRKGRKKRR